MTRMPYASFSPPLIRKIPKRLGSLRKSENFTILNLDFERQTPLSKRENRFEKKRRFQFYKKSKSNSTSYSRRFFPKAILEKRSSMPINFGTNLKFTSPTEFMRSITMVSKTPFDPAQ